MIGLFRTPVDPVFRRIAAFSSRNAPRPIIGELSKQQCATGYWMAVDWERDSETETKILHS
jgi:hypothetical protein